MVGKGFTALSCEPLIYVAIGVISLFVVQHIYFHIKSFGLLTHLSSGKKQTTSVLLLNQLQHIFLLSDYIPKELLDKIGNDYILRYKNGEYIFEEELTDDFFSGLVDIEEIINKQQKDQINKRIKQKTLNKYY